MPKTLALEYDDGTVTIVRPRFDQMKDIGNRVNTLTQLAGPAEIMAHADFLTVMKAACEKSADYETLQKLDYEDAYAVWEHYLELGRFDDFLSEASQRLVDRRLKTMEANIKGMEKQVAMLKKQGALPADFSVTDALNQFGGGMLPDLLQSGSPMLDSEDEPSK